MKRVASVKSGQTISAMEQTTFPFFSLIIFFEKKPEQTNRFFHPQLTDVKDAERKRQVDVKIAEISDGGRQTSGRWRAPNIRSMEGAKHPVEKTCWVLCLRTFRLLRHNKQQQAPRAIAPNVGSQHRVVFSNQCLLFLVTRSLSMMWFSRLVVRLGPWLQLCEVMLVSNAFNY